MSTILTFLKYQKNNHKLFSLLSDIEEGLYDIKNIKIENPIFICGMPRSGTTFITHLLDASGYFSSFKYKYLPFYTIPIFWNYFNRFFYFAKKNSKRIHGDNINVGLDSADSFEEIIWKNNLDNYNEKGFWSHISDQNDKNLIVKLESYIKKVVKLGNKRNYISKNNNNAFRIKYLLKKFPSSKILFVIRNPIDLAYSSAKVHLKFLKLHNFNFNFSEELKELGHLEFGYYRKLFSNNQIEKKIEKNIKFKIIKFYLKGYQEFLEYIMKSYSEELKSKRVITFNYDNLKSYNEIKILLSNLNIESNENLVNFFKSNFKITKKRTNLKKIEKEFELNIYNDFKQLSII